MIENKEERIMPKGSKVEEVYRALRDKGMSKERAAKIAQSQTGQALATGEPSKHENSVHYQNGMARAAQEIENRMMNGGPGSGRKGHKTPSRDGAVRKAAFQYSPQQIDAARKAMKAKQEKESLSPRKKERRERVEKTASGYSERDIAAARKALAARNSQLIKVGDHVWTGHSPIFADLFSDKNATKPKKERVLEIREGGYSGKKVQSSSNPSSVLFFSGSNALLREVKKA